MKEFFDFLAQNPLALSIIEGWFIAFAIFILFMYIDAYLQGRDISFWPPKIGKKVKNNSLTKSPVKNKKLKESEKLTANRLVDLKTISKIESTNIDITSSAISDGKLLELSLENITEFILAEASSHPLLFTNTFSSMPFNYSNNIIFVTWNGTKLIVERILKREKAYPTMDVWLSCGALYRKATTLRYRSSTSKAIISVSEFHQIINLYKKLLQNIKKFTSLNNKDGGYESSEIGIFESLLDEAEFAFNNENPDIGIVRLEALLSSIHKFLISNTPQTPNSNLQNKPLLTPKLTGNGNKTILLVDDEKSIISLLSPIILEAGYRVATCEDGEDALKAIVENDYDLVITDIMMPSLNGFAVINGSKTINPKAKIMVVTAFSGAGNMAKAINEIAHHVEKPFNPDELIQLIKEILKD